MPTIDEEFHAALAEVFESPALRRLVLKRTLEGQGVLLSAYQLRRLEKQLITEGGEPPRFRLKEDQLTGEARESVRRDGSVVVDADAVGLHMDQIVREGLEALDIKGLVGQSGGALLKSLKRDSRLMLEDRGRTQQDFGRRLNRIWGKAIDLLEMQLVISLEVGEAFNEEERPAAAGENDYEFEALIRLHAKACQIASEILVLLRAGHADGAMARWRALHEATAVAYFIRTKGGDIAERYLLHEVVEAHKAAVEQQRHAAALGSQLLSVEELQGMREARDHLVERFGEEYREDLGWAAAAIRKKRPLIVDIERAAGLEHWRPYYRMASLGVHASSRGIFFQLGQPLDGPDLLVAGVSNVGLADPGHATAISLSQITCTLLISKTNLERLVICAVLQDLVDDIGDAFIKAHEALEGASGG